MCGARRGEWDCFIDVAHRGQGYSNTFRNLAKVIDSSWVPLAHIWLTLCDFFLTFKLKVHTKMVFKKKSRSNNKFRHTDSGLAIFRIFHTHDFLRHLALKWCEPYKAKARGMD
jgi:hypothetical protein